MHKIKISYLIHVAKKKVTIMFVSTLLAHDVKQKKIPRTNLNLKKNWDHPEAKKKSLKNSSFKKIAHNDDIVREMQEKAKELPGLFFINLWPFYPKPRYS